MLEPTAGSVTLGGRDLLALVVADRDSERVVRARSNTLWLGAWVTLLSVAFALPTALLADRSRSARWLDLVMAVPFLTPPFLVSLAWTQVVGRRGYASRLGLDGVFLQDALYSVAGMAVLMAVNYVPLVCFALRAQLARMPSGLGWAAASAGAGRLTRLWLVVVLLLAPTLLAGGFLAFVSAIGEYGTPLVIGQRIGYPVVATEIARLVGVFTIDLSLASALGASLLVVGAGAYLLGRTMSRGDLRVAGRSHYPPPALLPAWARLGAAAGWRSWPRCRSPSLRSPWRSASSAAGTRPGWPDGPCTAPPPSCFYYLAQYLPFVVQYVQAGQAGISPSFERAARVHGASAFVTFWRDASRRVDATRDRRSWRGPPADTGMTSAP